MFAERWRVSTGESHVGGLVAQNKGEEHRCCPGTRDCSHKWADAGPEFPFIPLFIYFFVAVVPSACSVGFADRSMGVIVCRWGRRELEREEQGGCAECSRMAMIPNSPEPPSIHLHLSLRADTLTSPLLSAPNQSVTFKERVCQPLHCVAYIYVIALWMGVVYLIPAVGRRELLSSGSGRSATGCLCGATLWSLPIGWSGDGPGRPQTASDGCRRCMQRRLQSCAREGWGWWCGWACCSWRGLTGKRDWS